MKRNVLHAVVVLGLLVAAGIAVWLYLRPGIVLTVTNSGTAALKDVKAHVTGNSYSLGDLAPGQAKSVSVVPTSESHVEIEVTAPDGASRRWNAGGYFEPGYRGTIVVEVNDAGVVRYDERLRVSGLP